MSDKDVCRTVQATPGLLKNKDFWNLILILCQFDGIIEGFSQWYCLKLGPRHLNSVQLPRLSHTFYALLILSNISVWSSIWRNFINCFTYGLPTTLKGLSDSDGGIQCYLRSWFIVRENRVFMDLGGIVLYL